LLRLLRAVALLASVAFVLGAGVSSVHAAEPEEDPSVDPSSPQAVVVEFLALGDRGDFEKAATFLELSRDQAERGPELARRLHAVLSRITSLAPELISGAAVGDLDDGLPKTIEQIGKVTTSRRATATGGAEAAEDAPAVLLQRRSRGEPPWVFSRKTVENVDRWYESLGDRWLIDNLPDSLLRTGWGGLAYWQWLTLPGVLAIAWLVGYLLARITRRLLRPLLTRNESVSNEVLLKRFSGPLTMGWMLATLRLLLPLLSLLPRADETVRSVLSAALVLLVFWAALRAVDLVADLLSRSNWATARAGTAALLPLGARIVKVLVGALAVVAVFAKLDYPIASLLAGLGIGGLAVALAAQKSFENLIGAFALGADQPFREGDFVRVDDFTATVESIGLRSTRFRTLDRTVVTIPNGKLSEMKLETFAARDRMRMNTILGLSYASTESQIRAVLEGVRAALESHPKLWPDSKMVRLIRFGESSLDVEVMAWFQTSDWDEFIAIREEMLLTMLGIVAQAGTSLAFPTRTVHVMRDGGPGPRTT
jgi:MscS family membrane protein